MSKLEHFVLRFVFPLSYAIGSIAFLIAAYSCYTDHLFASILFTICGLWLGFWAIAASTVSFIPEVWDGKQPPKDALRQLCIKEGVWFEKQPSKEALRQIAEW